MCKYKNLCANHRQIMDIPAIAQSLKEVWEVQKDRFRDLLAVALSSHNQMCDTISAHDRFVNQLSLTVVMPSL